MLHIPLLQSEEGFCSLSPSGPFSCVRCSWLSFEPTLVVGGMAGDIPVDEKFVAEEASVVLVVWNRSFLLGEGSLPRLATA